MFEVGDIAFTYCSATDTIEKCTITKISEEGYELHSTCSVNRKGEKVGFGIGTFTRPSSNDLFEMPQDAWDDGSNIERNLSRCYADQIITIEDLIKFPFEHELMSGKADPFALEAYKDKARELLGVEF